jgi:hypothetical protein
MDKNDKVAIIVVLIIIVSPFISVPILENIALQQQLTTPTPLYRLLAFYDQVRDNEFVPTDISFTNQTLWDEWYTNFTAKMVLHDTNERNYFQKESSLYLPTSPYLANKTLYQLLGSTWKSPLTNSYRIPSLDLRIETIISPQNTSYLYGNENPRFPVETALTKLGECKDIAMLDSAVLTSNGYQTILADIDDPNNPNYPEGFKHEFLFVKIADNFTAANSTLSSWINNYFLWGLSLSGGSASQLINNGLGNITNLLWSWNINGHNTDYVWLMLDPTFRSESWPTQSQALFMPSWFTWYISNSKLKELEDHLAGAIVSVNQTVTRDSGVPL